MNRIHSSTKNYLHIKSACSLIPDHSNHRTVFAYIIYEFRNIPIVWINRIYQHPPKRIPFIKHTCPIAAHVQSPYRMSHKWTQTKGYDQHPVFWRPRTNNGSISSLSYYIMYAMAIVLWIYHHELWGDVYGRANSDFARATNFRKFVHKFV